jgi:hypothetical protein
VAKGLVDVADALPRLELALALYRTVAMQQSLSDVYAIILRFLIRVKDWLDEGPLKRALHAVTRPTELRYDDLLQDLRLATQSMMGMAVAASQAEQRDIHLTLLEIKQLILCQSHPLVRLFNALIKTFSTPAAQRYRSTKHQSSFDGPSILTDPHSSRRCANRIARKVPSVYCSTL